MKLKIDGNLGIGGIKENETLKAKKNQFKREAIKEWKKTEFHKIYRNVAFCGIALVLIVHITGYILVLFPHVEIVEAIILFPLMIYMVIYLSKHHEYVKSYIDEKIIEEFEEKKDIK
jgi:Ca2+/Na+ antiporter